MKEMRRSNGGGDDERKELNGSNTVSSQTITDDGSLKGGFCLRVNGEPNGDGSVVHRWWKSGEWSLIGKRVEERDVEGVFWLKGKKKMGCEWVERKKIRLKPNKMGNLHK